MKRILKSEQELLEIVKHELAKLNVCSGIYIGPIKAQKLDETGCNWRLALSCGEKEQIYSCIDAIKEVIQKMRLEFNVDIWLA